MLNCCCLTCSANDWSRPMSKLLRKSYTRWSWRHTVELICHTWTLRDTRIFFYALPVHLLLLVAFHVASLGNVSSSAATDQILKTNVYFAFEKWELLQPQAWFPVPPVRQNNLQGVYPNPVIHSRAECKMCTHWHVLTQSTANPFSVLRSKQFKDFWPVVSWAPWWALGDIDDFISVTIFLWYPHTD